MGLSEAETIPPVITFTVSPPPPLPTIPGYDIQELVGKGGMGRVYRARHLALGRTVAIKFLTAEPEERILTRFRDEARAVAKLQHPNIAQLYDSGTSENRPYYTLEYVDGGTLAARFDGEPQDPRDVTRLMEILARAIHFSHEHGILHRDLKPGNVLMTSDGIPKIADFGLAKEIEPVNPGQSTIPGAAALTRTGEIMGTPAYMPPEQASGVTSKITPAADVYALGAMMYEGLTGRPPFQAPDALQTLFLVLGSEPVSPRVLQPKLPKDLETICLKCLEKSPKKRYPSAAELAGDLKLFLDGEPILARPVGGIERAVKWATRRKAAAALIGVSILLVFAIIGFGILEAFNAANVREKNKLLAKQNEDLEKAKADSDKSFDLATKTLDTVVRDVGLKLQGVPKADKTALFIERESAELYRKLSEMRPNDREVAHRYIYGLGTLASLENLYGDARAARACLAKQEELLNRELELDSKNLRLRNAQVQSQLSRVIAAQSEIPPVRAEVERAKYAILVKTLAEDFPGSPESHISTVQVAWQKGIAASAKKDVEGQLEALREGVLAARAFAAAHPSHPNSKNFLATSLNQLGSVHLAQDHLEEAEACYSEMEDLFTALNAAERETETTREKLATTVSQRGHIALYRGRNSLAEQKLLAAETLFRSLRRDYPLNQMYVLSLGDCLYYRAELAKKSDKATAAKYLEEATKLLEDLLKATPKNPDYLYFRDAYRDALKEVSK